MAAVKVLLGVSQRAAPVTHTLTCVSRSLWRQRWFHDRMLSASADAHVNHTPLFLDTMSLRFQSDSTVLSNF